ncbi:MAG: ATP-binding protein [Bacteroidota bacterium]
MPSSNPKKLVLRNALIIAGVYLATYLFLLFSIGEKSFLFVLITTLVVFQTTYLLWNHSLDKFIIERIRILYKNIRRQKSGRELNIEKLAIHDALAKVEEDVELWGKMQEDEIEQLKKLAQYRREFIGNVSHELRTPIFNIQGYVLTLLDGGIDDPTINKDYLRRTEKSINRMIAIVDDLEKISLLESGQLKLEYSNFDIILLTKEVIEILEPKGNEKNTKLVFGENYEKAVFVFADREKIRQVLTNLIDNSIKYGRQDGKTKLSFYDMDDRVLIEVADNGIGVDAQDIPRLFERFYRAEKARSREHGGSGLGLAIVKHIIEAHDEPINVRSSPGIGTTFGFTLKKAKQ